MPAQAGDFYGAGYGGGDSYYSYQRYESGERYVRGYQAPPYVAAYGGYGYRPYPSGTYGAYAGCPLVPLADGRGGWIWSVRAGCY